MSSTNDRWQREADFFDAQARQASASVVPLDPAVIRRYSDCTVESARYPLEHAFALAGNLAGVSVLDVGCGEGSNSVLLATLGARVTGVDISTEAIALARRRAEVNGVSSSVSFRASPIEQIDEWGEKFDLIWCEAFLHHVLADLDVVTRRLVSWTRKGGRLIIIEPIALSRPLRALRRIVPVRAEATPDERPLLPSELELLERTVPNSTTRYFRCLGRLARFTLPGGSYEHASTTRKRITDLLTDVDSRIFRLPGGTRCASIAVVSGIRDT